MTWDDRFARAEKTGKFTKEDEIKSKEKISDIDDDIAMEIMVFTILVRNNRVMDAKVQYGVLLEAIESKTRKVEDEAQGKVSETILKNQEKISWIEKGVKAWTLRLEKVRNTGGFTDEEKRDAENFDEQLSKFAGEEFAERMLFGTKVFEDDFIGVEDTLQRIANTIDMEKPDKIIMWLDRLNRAKIWGYFTKEDKELARDIKFCAVSEIDHVMDWKVINDDINTDDISFLADDFADYAEYDRVEEALECYESIQNYKKEALILMKKATHA